MGKTGAFLHHDRREHGELAVSEALSCWDEIAVPLDLEARREQASRCMNCGVAFCQSGMSFGRARPSGCPLHNLIPEWNDLVWRDLFDQAAGRLSLTNPFPEFTGRVCPALCEAACNLGRDRGATTIKDNERAISDAQWASGGPALLAPPAPDAKKALVIGSGPSGLACAYELARNGFFVTVAEKSDRAGGLLMYGIPNMKLDKSVVARRVAWLEESSVVFNTGLDATDASAIIPLAKDVDAVCVCVGAGVARGFSVPGAEGAGVTLAVDYLTQATKAMLDGTQSAIDMKGKRVVVIGGGDTGTDCVATALRQGCADVRQLEFMPEPPETADVWPEWPQIKKTDYGQLEAIAVQGEDPRTFAANTKEVLRDEDGNVAGLRIVRLDWSQGRPDEIAGSEYEIACDAVLVATGFTGPDRHVFDALDVEVDGRGYAILAAGSHRVVSGDAVFVAGDARRGASLVVNAIAEGLECAREVVATL
jgi:glutamate synthase (NADPH/NADH) small chain